MAARNLDRYLRRYTTLSSVLDMLANRRLVLLSPAKWDDANDVQFMEWYADSVDAGSVLALCCTMSSETYHHWRVFTQGIDGVCVEFDRQLLESSFDGSPGIEARPVDYLLIRELSEKRRTSARLLPFFKREGYSDEREYRIVATIDEKAKQTYDLPIDLGSINRLIFNPWLPPALATNLRKIIRGIGGCENLKIVSSKLTNSPSWKAAGHRLVS